MSRSPLKVAAEKLVLSRETLRALHTGPREEEAAFCTRGGYSCVKCIDLPPTC